MSVSGRRGFDLFGASSTATASASKKSVRAAEQDRPDVAAARAAWVDDQAKLDPERLVFIDETGTSTNMARLRGRARLRATALTAPCVIVIPISAFSSMAVSVARPLSVSV